MTVQSNQNGLACPGQYFDDHAGETQMLSEEDKGKLANRLRRVSGQVAAVQRMMDEDVYCVDILTQIAAASGALGKVGQLLLESHIQSCVADAVRSGDAQRQEEKLAELIEIFRKYASIVD
ncbi:metal-sensitive transcriptional regulator [Pirellulimonas nuda]|uniref:metal-sensitive transcriptional regulator n=1 Tax=Pirellulimonas nuda TaxID=2528009 RepID=UPI0028F420A9|nr:metal-sensitive transcriptional regulator [Pirellulimonas nuda]